MNLKHGMAGVALAAAALWMGGNAFAGRYDEAVAADFLSPAEMEQALWGKQRDATADAVRRDHERKADGARRGYETQKNVVYGLGQLEKAGGWAKQATSVAAAATDLAGAWKPLSDMDQSIADQMKGGPKIPSRCAEDASCRVCFQDAQNSLNINRYALIKLGAIGKWTDTFTTKSLAFGDNVSGVHGVAGIAWQAERQKIEASHASFGKQYSAKYHELIGYLENSLNKIGQCEARYFRNDDWYDRYGFMYYSYMADRYRR